jgi:hypothetical protein
MRRSFLNIMMSLVKIIRTLVELSILSTTSFLKTIYLDSKSTIHYRMHTNLRLKLRSETYFCLKSLHRASTRSALFGCCLVFSCFPPASEASREVANFN